MQPYSSVPRKKSGLLDPGATALDQNDQHEHQPDSDVDEIQQVGDPPNGNKRHRPGPPTRRFQTPPERANALPRVN